MIPIYDLKQHIDIVDVVGTYTELYGIGNRLRAKINPVREGGDFDVYQDTQKWYDHGTGEGGDVVDFIRNVENLNIGESIAFLEQNYLGTNSSDDKHQYRALSQPKVVVEQTIEEENALIDGLKEMAARCLNAFAGKKWSSFTLESEDLKGATTDQSIIRVSPIFEKLFEGQLIPADEKFAKYLFNKIIGYDPYFNCPTILVRDEAERVVDIVRYRPERDGVPLKQKYLVARNTIKPHKRGRSFIFPFQQQMMKITHKERYCFVGEGLKNAVNASLMGIPFISIESASGINDKLISFLKGPRMTDIVLIGALDGDAAGEKAYNKIREDIDLSKNLFDFDSETDFTDYLKELRKDVIDESERAS